MSMENWHLLVVEDDPDGQEVVSRMLKYHRIPISVVGTAEDALETLQAENDITGCIIDLHLPGMDGWSLLKAIKADAATADLPCVAVTAYHSEEVAVHAIEAGFASYFPKPLDATSFVRELGFIFEGD